VAELERQDIQGILLSAYIHLSCAAYLLLRVEDAAAGRAWISRIAGDITNAERKQESWSLNIALSHSGLSHLGLDDDALATFPIAFQEGVASPKRSHILGDTNESAPAHWQWGNEANPVDIVLMVFGADEKALDEQLELRRAQIAASGGIVEVLALGAGRQSDTREHFGFNDGIGQPVIEGSGRVKNQMERTGHATEIKPGEFILGYINEYGIPATSPTVDAARDPGNLLPEFQVHTDLRFEGQTTKRVHDLGRNGTYLVFRQLHQNVADFWNFLDEATRTPDGASDVAARERLAAKFVGRWRSGTPLVKSPNADSEAFNTDNDFGYAETDRHGFACPIGAHVRRCNPRDSIGDDPKSGLQVANRHRLMRRGRLYGPRIADMMVDDGAERGLHFLCVNTDIERHFEFVQQTWINNPVFSGLNGEVDPLMGDQDNNSRTMTVQGDPLRVRIHGLRRFVTVKGGAYFFLPGLRALRYLGNLPA